MFARDSGMTMIEAIPMEDSQAVLWTLGQAGCLIRSCGMTVAMDPYLSDSAAAIAPETARVIPVPIPPQELKADLFLVTHDHQDHLDPETIQPYRFKERTVFVAPRLACRKLAQIGVPEHNIVRVDRGEEKSVQGVVIRGIEALPTEPAVEDTTGYRLQFSNGRTLYHCSDTGPSQQLFRAAPAAEVLLVCINGKWGNLGLSDAVRLTRAVHPRVVIPNHYDMMGNNLENPETFARLMRQEDPAIQVKILKVLEPFIWNA